MRLFVVADPPGAVREELASWARSLKRGPGFRIVAPENIHLTLAFLGELPATDVDAICGALAAAAQETPGEIQRLRIGGPLLLPPRRPRVLAAAILDPEARLADLQSAAARQLGEAVGYSESRRFRPHLTAARLSRDAVIGAELDPPPALEFTVARLTLFRSHLGQSGARYEPLDAVEL
jgi:2'-5' RNA ligase